MNKAKFVALWMFLFVLMALLVATFSSCTTTKNVDKATTNTTDTREQELSDSLRTIRLEKEKLESDIKELQYAGVVFKTDTVNHHDTITNTVEITKEGAIKATGNISSAYVSKSLMARIVAEKERTIDSLRSVKEKVRYINTTYTVQTTKYKKTQFLGWFWLLLIGFMGGLYVGISKHSFFK